MEIENTAFAAPGYYAGMGFGVPAGIGVAAHASGCFACVNRVLGSNPLLRALTMPSQAQRLLFVVEAGLSTCERSVIVRKRKFQLLPSHAAVRMQKWICRMHMRCVCSFCRNIFRCIFLIPA